MVSSVDFRQSSNQHSSLTSSLLFNDENLQSMCETYWNLILTFQKSHYGEMRESNIYKDIRDRVALMLDILEYIQISV